MVKKSKRLKEALRKMKAEESKPLAFIESITRIQVGSLEIGHCGTIRVWREESRVEPYELQNLDLYETVASYHPMYIREIAIAITKLDRVTAVEYTNAEGNGGVLYVTW